MIEAPTVLLGFGPFGGEVLDRVARSMRGDHDLLRSLRCDGSLSGVRPLLAALEPALEELLRAGLAAGRGREEPRLDLALFASAEEGEAGALLHTCEALARLMGERFGGLFPAHLPAEQQRALLQLVVTVPALPSPEAAAALQRIRSLEAWAEASARHPLLARLWLVGAQTSAGLLSRAERASTCASFARAAFGSGLREEEEVARRLRHPAPGEGRVGFLSLAGADTPLARLQDYAALRAAYDALDRLVERVGAAPDAEGHAATGALRPEAWLAPFQTGGPAERCRRLAASLSGRPSRLPEPVRLRAFESADAIRARLAPLLRPATEARDPSQVDEEALQAALAALDRAESGAVAQIERDIEATLESALGPRSGLRRLTEVEAGLRFLQARLRDDQAADAAALDRPAALDGDPLRQEIEDALAALPRPWSLRAAAAAVGFAACSAATAFLLALGSRSLLRTIGGQPAAPVLGAGSPAAQAAFSWQELGPWLGGAAFGLLAAFAFAWFAAKAGRKELELLLERRRNALEELWQRGGAGFAGGQVEAQLALRRRRVRRSALLCLARSLERLALLRRSLEQHRQELRRRLRGLGVDPRERPEEDDLSPLLESGGLLHVHLVPPRMLARWIARCRAVVDPEIWADRFVEACWPAGGLGEDLPCADLAAMGAAARQQIAPLRESGLFEDPETSAAAAESVVAFATQVPVALAAPCLPRDEYGHPLPGSRGAAFVVAPRGGMESLEQALAGRAPGLPVLRSNSGAAGVLFVRTWKGFTTEQIARGAGIDVQALQSEAEAAG